MEGRITRGLGGFYTVYLSDGTFLTCKARGRFRNDGISPLPGDYVVVSEQQGGTGRLDEILPRRNVFIRPPVANIDALVLVASLAPPHSTTFWIDRILAVAHQKGTQAILCFNKIDVGDDTDTLTALYQNIGYTVLQTSAVTGTGLDQLRQAIKGKLVAFSGHSGVGKSSLLNLLSPELALPIGDISEKLGRGRHTTRHVELFQLDADTWMADTPGFSAFDPDQMDFVERVELPRLFPEFAQYAGECRFQDCVHIDTKKCAVLDAVATGHIPQSRYDSYRQLYESLKDVHPWEKKKG